MRYIEIESLENGAHRNQTGGVCPSGWAIVPDSIEIPDTFPFVVIEVEDGCVISMTPGTVPVIEVTPAEQRKIIYETGPRIEWENELHTITEMAELWEYYAAEGSSKAEDIQLLIAAEKSIIRQEYPDRKE